ncbi:MAG: UDP-N-acetylmuramoyl-L-alanine--D-glutamate ligase [Clostridia bacterium]|nr:UDP-N-acetylmuramoyl-L-alanine--D-glutamate ligase [Clostridia bacterium]
MLYEYIKQLISGKKVIILGFGREGRSTFNVINRAGGFDELAVSDLNPVTDVDVPVFSGADYQKAVEKYDIVFKSPGVVLEDFTQKDKVISQTDVIIDCFKERMIGITGTKGKSTTTSLIYHVLKCNGKKPVLMGNIGIPAFDVADTLEDDGLIVYELSCHQLEFAKKSPHRGVLLNIYPEHLDHYGTFEKYKAAKENIYRNMSSSDFLVCGYEFLPEEFNGSVVSVSMDCHKADFVAEESSVSGDGFALKPECMLFGVHNMYNIGVAYAVCRDCGVTLTDFSEALKTFKPLPHRLELFAEINGVRYFDDSISTIPETTIKAVSSVKNPGTLILGGMDRGVELGALAEFLIENPVPNLILMPDTGIKIYDYISEKCTSRIYLVADLKEAAEAAKAVTEPGYACILSPAAASYGFFKNFEERGDCFKKYIFGR